MAAKSTIKSPLSPAGTHDGPSPPSRIRLRLKTAQDCAAEMSKLYKEGKAGSRDVGDVSKLANVLGLMARLIETSDLEARLQKLEKADD